MSGVCECDYEWCLQTKSLAGPVACVLRSGVAMDKLQITFQLHTNVLITF